MAKRDIAISIESSPTPEEIKIIGNGLRQHNDQHVPADGDSSFAVFMRGEDGVILGGILSTIGRIFAAVYNANLDRAIPNLIAEFADN